MTIYVIPTVPTFHIGRSFEKLVGLDFSVIYPQPHGKTGQFYFPGGECYCQLPGISELQDQEVVVLHSGYSRYPVNDGLEFLRQTLSILREPRLAGGGDLRPPRKVILYSMCLANLFPTE